MKKLLALLLALMMVFALAACGENTEKPSNDNPGVSQSGESNNTDPNAPVSSIGNAAGRGSYTKHNAEDAQKLLVSMGLPEYPGGEILYLLPPPHLPLRQDQGNDLPPRGGT